MKHRRKLSSMRARWIDYSSPGWYHCTMCLKRRIDMFGEIRDDEMHLNEFGKIVQRLIIQATDKYDGLQIETFCVMPDHVHLLIRITTAGHVSKPTQVLSHAEWKKERRKMLIPLAVGFIKASSAREINKIRGMTGTPLWQETYFDRRVTDDEFVDNIRGYIRYNARHHSPVQRDRSRQGRT
ncbi:transposase [bacterium]|nr:transposase [bacterium]